ncbi:2956_t:CDS:1, partial [Funneliformis mosseae]
SSSASINQLPILISTPIPTITIVEKLQKSSVLSNTIQNKTYFYHY